MKIDDPSVMMSQTAAKVAVKRDAQRVMALRDAPCAALDHTTVKAAVMMAAPRVMASRDVLRVAQNRMTAKVVAVMVAPHVTAFHAAATEEVTAVAQRVEVKEAVTPDDSHLSSTEMSRAVASSDCANHAVRHCHCYHRSSCAVEDWGAPPVDNQAAAPDHQLADHFAALLSAKLRGQANCQTNSTMD